MTTAADLKEAAANLAKTAASLQRHIKDEGQKIGDAYGKTYAKAADERIKEMDFELQRAGDLVTELRRQMKSLERHAAKYFAIERATRAALKDGAKAIDISYLLTIINPPAKPDNEEN